MILIYFNVTFYVAVTALPTDAPNIAYVQVKASGNVDCEAWKVTIVTLSYFCSLSLAYMD